MRGARGLAGSAAARYTELLRDVDGLETPLADDADHVRSWFVYVVELEEGIDRERVIASLEAEGIQTARYLPCIHLQRYMRDLFGFREGLCPVAESLARRTLAIPFHTGLAAGVVLASTAGALNVDLFAFLFGSILTVTREDLVVVAALGTGALAAIGLLYRALVGVVVDEEGAQVAGVPVAALNVLVAGLAGLTIGLSMQIVGILLVAALMVLPGRSAGSPSPPPARSPGWRTSCCGCFPMRPWPRASPSWGTRPATSRGCSSSGASSICAPMRC